MYVVFGLADWTGGNHADDNELNIEVTGVNCIYCIDNLRTIAKIDFLLSLFLILGTKAQFLPFFDVLSVDCGHLQCW